MDTSLIRVEFYFPHVTGETDIHSNSKSMGDIDMCVCVCGGESVWHPMGTKKVSVS